MSDNFGKVIQVIGPVIDVRFSVEKTYRLFTRLSALQAAKVTRP